VETSSKWYRLMDLLRASGIPVFEFPEDGARALADMARYAELRDRKKEAPPTLQVDRAAAEAVLKRHEGKDAFIPQADAFELLRAYGIPAPRTATLSGPADLSRAAKEVGFPCVLKVESQDVVHKSDEGGVVLGIGDEAALKTALDQMQKRFSGKTATYLLMEQKAPGYEVIIGSSAAPGLGNLVMFGLGGVLVEVMKDVVVAVPPLSRPEASEMLRGIKGFPVLTGVRGKPGADLKALEDLLLRVSRLAADFPSIVEMDLNPILAYPAGTPPAAVDARIKVR